LEAQMMGQLRINMPSSHDYMHVVHCARFFERETRATIGENTTIRSRMPSCIDRLPGCGAAPARFLPSRCCSASSLRVLADDTAGLGLAALSPIGLVTLLMLQRCQRAGFAREYGRRQALGFFRCCAEITHSAAGAPGAALQCEAGILSCCALAPIGIS
jgi:hypothetical protein